VTAVFARFSLDSARTKIPIAKMAASQKINRAALDIFILLVLFYAPVSDLLFRIAADALRFSARDIAQVLARNASRISKRQARNPERKVTELLPALAYRYDRPRFDRLCLAFAVNDFDISAVARVWDAAWVWARIGA
jgi:hypothetical protein